MRTFEVCHVIPAIDYCQLIFEVYYNYFCIIVIIIVNYILLLRPANVRKSSGET